MSPSRRQLRTTPSAGRAGRSDAAEALDPLLAPRRPPSRAAPAVAQDRLAAIGQVAAGVAHDFNNIVTVISLCAQLLESQRGLDELGREQLADIRREAERGASMAWQILDFAHHGPINRVPVDLDDLFADLLPVLRRTQPARISIDVHADRAEHRVSGDAVRLEQIVCNLAANACDAMPTGGRLDITLGRADVAPARAWARGPWVRVSFRDSGDGIAPEVLPRVLEPFFTTKPPGHGTGLGLAQVDALVTQHDGHVHVRSTPGDGTTVDVWLPALGGTEG